MNQNNLKTREAFCGFNFIKAEGFVAVTEVGVKNPVVPAHGQQYGGPWKIQIFSEIFLSAADLMEASAPLTA
jgi:hypothetical protein